MIYTSNHHVCLFDHPFVPVGNRIPLRHIFQRRIDGTVIQGSIRRSVRIRQNQDGFQFRVLLFQFIQNFCSEQVEISVSAEIEFVIPLLQKGTKFAGQMGFDFIMF